MAITKAIARAGTDADDKAKLLSKPHAALAEAAEADELSIEELDRPAFGVSGHSCAVSNWPSFSH